MHRWLALSVLIVAVDQASKLVASKMLTLHIPVEVVPYLNLTLVHNPGAAFSLFSEMGGWQRWVLLAVTFVVCVFLYSWLRRLDRSETMSSAAIALVIGGAVGNAFDRLAYGYVVDFIDVYYGKYHWPVFNVADAAITVGVLALVLAAARSR